MGIGCISLTVQLIRALSLVIQELMEMDMHHVIRTHGLSDDHAQYFICQALCA